MQVSGVAITVLADNRSAQGLESEHGLSFWIRTANRTILFDTGQGDAMPRNAASLGIDIGTADAVVLSHGHYDHTGNLRLALERAGRAELLLHPDALRPRYSIHASPKPIGMPAAAREAVRAASDARCRWVTRPTELDAGVWLTGPVPRETAFENAGGPFYWDEAGKEPDPISDDLSLCVRTGAGWVVCLGCCHAGVVNTLRHIPRELGGGKILAVIGGMHLCHADAERLERTTAAFATYDVPRLYPCHCTGEAATAFLRQRFPRAVQPGFAGLQIAFKRDH
jgi:7,8-dihydropterin-6-yl-methyl-4-(beta-D-ribofuranosyl)aminobenzene 5'-phosphate synthase